jgi:hypothetical protein
VVTDGVNAARCVLCWFETNFRQNLRRLRVTNDALTDAVATDGRLNADERIPCGDVVSRIIDSPATVKRRLCVAAVALQQRCHGGCVTICAKRKFARLKFAVQRTRSGDGP